MKKQHADYREVLGARVGSACHFEDCRVYIFFPNLYDEGTERSFLTDDEYGRFIDMLLKTIHTLYSSHICQHLPTTWDDACYRALQNKELRQKSQNHGFKCSIIFLLVDMKNYRIRM